MLATAPTLPSAGIPSLSMGRKYDVISNSLVSRIKEFETEVGDTKQPLFYPQVKIKRWDNEVNFSARLVHDEPGVVSYDRKSLKWTTSALEARFYDRGGFEDGGGYEFEVLLLRRPRNNTLAWTVRHKGLEFLHQPSLTNERPGAQRPDNVVGSYAVYHATQAGNYSQLGGHNYRCGKAFHIYRPWAQDALGRRVWCGLDVVHGLLTITVPQSFLDSAVYPVLLDPTFGYTTAGASTDNPSINWVWSKTPVNPSGAGTLTLTDINIHNKKRGTQTGGGSTVTGTAYTDSSGPATRVVAEGTAATCPASSSWSTITLAGGTVTAGAQHWLGTRAPSINTGNGTDNDVDVSFDTNGGASELEYKTSVSGTAQPFPDPAPGSRSTATNERWSTYCSFTASGGGLLPPRNLVSYAVRRAAEW